MAESFSQDFKRFFARGLAVVLPTVLTLWILWQALGFLFNNVAAPINRATRLGVLWVVPQVFEEESLPAWFSIDDDRLLEERIAGEVRDSVTDAALRKELRRQYLSEFWDTHWYLNLSGLFVAILLVYLAGVLLGNFFGRQIYARLERLIAQVPGFKQVYPHVKQVVDLILGEKKMAFSKVVLVEYPSKGIWTIGFLTGASLRVIDGPAGGKVVSVFIPTSPTPFTGFTINVLESQVMEVQVSVEEALRFVITAGVLTPEIDDRKPKDNGRPDIVAPLGPRSVAAASPDEARRAAESQLGNQLGSGQTPPADGDSAPNE